MGKGVNRRVLSPLLSASLQSEPTDLASHASDVSKKIPDEISRFRTPRDGTVVKGGGPRSCQPKSHINERWHESPLDFNGEWIPGACSKVAARDASVALQFTQLYRSRMREERALAAEKWLSALSQEPTIKGEFPVLETDHLCPAELLLRTVIPPILGRTKTQRPQRQKVTMIVGKPSWTLYWRGIRHLTS